MAKDSFLSVLSMSLENLVNKNVLSQPVYEPGKPIEAVARELGLDPAGIAKLASNESPFGSSPKAVAAVKAWADNAWLYPDGGCCELKNKLAAKRGVAPEQLILGNGSNEIIELLGHTFLGEGDEVVFGSQAFIVYKLVTLLFGANPVEVPMPQFCHDLDAMANAVTDRTRLIFVASPNNPTGTANTESDLMEFARALPEHVVFCLDEAYAEYSENPPDLRPLIDEGRNVICMRTFSKIFGLAGFRIGYGYASREMVALLNRIRQPFNVNAAAQVAALAALDDDGFIQDCRSRNHANGKVLVAGLRELGLNPVPTEANFLLVEFVNAMEAFHTLQANGVIVRPLQPYNLPNHLRLTIGTKEQNLKMLNILSDYLPS